jgi:hypothetical protein
MRLTLKLNARSTGTALCVAGAALLVDPGLLVLKSARDLPWPLLAAGLALALELIALAFWWWARSSEDAADQLRRWSWVRRPAQALWLAAAVGALGVRLASNSPAQPGLSQVAAAAVIFAGLELVAALPLARAYSDLSGPLLTIRPWLPALLPSAGFVVLWTLSALWSEFVLLQRIAEALLILTALLATLRAFGRLQLAAALRWLTVWDCAMGAALVGTRTVLPTVALLLWLGACSGHVFMLAGELRGAAPRRGAMLSRMWRAAGWLSTAALSWPLLVAIAARPPSPGVVLTLIGAATTTLLVGYVSVRRVVRAPERRSMMRAESALTLGHVSALVALAVGPAALGAALVFGYRPLLSASSLATLPALGGLLMALLGSRPRAALSTSLAVAGERSRSAARTAFRVVTDSERRLVNALERATRTAVAPLRDLHTGDAQEYLLFLVGLSVLALVLPFLK